jgi:hypothetical protein
MNQQKERLKTGGLSALLNELHANLERATHPKIWRLCAGAGDI